MRDESEISCLNYHSFHHDCCRSRLIFSSRANPFLSTKELTWKSSFSWFGGRSHHHFFSVRFVRMKNNYCHHLLSKKIPYAAMIFSDPYFEIRPTIKSEIVDQNLRKHCLK